VELVLPGRNDFALVLYAGRSYYEMLDAGVKLYEMDDAIMHAKTAVIDGVFSTVGSSNLDWRSLASNNELNVIVLGEEFGAEMQRQFDKDRAASVPIEIQDWQRRGLHRRAMEWFGRVVERWM
jgi:cardiolipin synthase A/B